MYRPAAFSEDRIEVMHALMRAHPLATLVTAGQSGLVANSLPVLVNSTSTEKGVLYAHLAKANEQLADLRSGAEALVIFQGPDAYISPSWYPSKTEHGTVVPTWNYVVVHAWGAPRVIDDPDWLRAQIGALTNAMEAGRPAQWAVEDAPEPFIAAQLNSIVGLEIPITRIEGKWKVSQNRSEPDRLGVAAGLQAESSLRMSRLVAESAAGPGFDLGQAPSHDRS
jgi:transcriptional regulator